MKYELQRHTNKIGQYSLGFILSPQLWQENENVFYKEKVSNRVNDGCLSGELSPESPVSLKSIT